MLAGCASNTSSAPAASDPDPSIKNTVASADSAAVNRAESWLRDAALPPGAVAVNSAPANFVQRYEWWCSPMAELTGYWTVESMTVAETANWLKSNPTADLIVLNPAPTPADLPMASVGNAPAFDSLEGIAYTVVQKGGGSAVRAEIGALGNNSVCPTPEPGTLLGGPGQG